MNLTNYKTSSRFRFHKLALVAVMLSAMMLTGCDDDDDYDPYSAISGVVTDYDTGLPLDNAAVTLSPTGLTASTDAAGVFAFSDLDAQQYTILVQKAGYQPNRKVVTAVSGEGVNVSIPLTRIPQ